MRLVKRSNMRNRLLALGLVTVAMPGISAAAVEFCLEGEFDLGARYQGMQPRPGEFSTARWCVVTEDHSDRVFLSMSGKSNPDMNGNWAVAFLPPNLVRIVNANAPPDIEFRGGETLYEARRNRRIDPRRLVAELNENPEWLRDSTLHGYTAVQYPGESAPVDVTLQDGKLRTLRTTADLPLRGRVAVIWRWDWSDQTAPTLQIEVDNDVLFRAHGAWRETAGTVGLWQATPGVDPVEVPGANWPARVNMSLVELSPGVLLVQGVRTGFQHLVVQTDDGLVVADAPAGWVELHQIPPVDLVPGLGVSGLSEEFVDFLRAEFPDQKITAVALTHAHDDHAGGARAFAAAGAVVYAPAELAEFLQSALNRDSMPADRLSGAGGEVRVVPVTEPITLGGTSRPVELLPLGTSPHTSSSLGVYVPEQGFFFQSDLHVPRTESEHPRAARAVTECWFAEWAVANLPPVTVVVNTHSAVQTPVSRLAKYLESDLCLRATVEP